MGGWRDLEEFLDEEFLDLPVGGKVYRIYDVDGDTALRVRRLAKLAQDAKEALDAGQEIDLSAAQLDDDEEEALYEQVLGEAYEELRADGVKNQRIKFVAQTAMIWIIADEDQAKRFWDAGGKGEAAAPLQGPNRHTRRASAATARTTQKPASGTATRASRSTTRKKAPASRGTKSSGSGA